MSVVISLVKPDALQISVAASPEASTNLQIEVNIPKWRKERQPA